MGDDIVSLNRLCAALNWALDGVIRQRQDKDKLIQESLRLLKLSFYRVNGDGCGYCAFCGGREDGGIVLHAKGCSYVKYRDNAEWSLVYPEDCNNAGE